MAPSSGTRIGGHGERRAVVARGDRRDHEPLGVARARGGPSRPGRQRVALAPPPHAPLAEQDARRRRAEAARVLLRRRGGRARGTPRRPRARRAGRRARRPPRTRPPAWSQCRWVSTTWVTVSGSIAGRAQRARARRGRARDRRWPRSLSLQRWPMPSSTACARRSARGRRRARGPTSGMRCFASGRWTRSQSTRGTIPCIAPPSSAKRDRTTARTVTPAGHRPRRAPQPPSPASSACRGRPRRRPPRRPRSARCARRRMPALRRRVAAGAARSRPVLADARAGASSRAPCAADAEAARDARRLGAARGRGSRRRSCRRGSTARCRPGRAAQSSLLLSDAAALALALSGAARDEPDERRGAPRRGREGAAALHARWSSRKRRGCLRRRSPGAPRVRAASGPPSASRGALPSSRRSRRRRGPCSAPRS